MADLRDLLLDLDIAVVHLALLPILITSGHVELFIIIHVIWLLGIGLLNCLCVLILVLLEEGLLQWVFLVNKVHFRLLFALDLALLPRAVRVTPPIKLRRPHKPKWMRHMRHRHWIDAMWSMDHAASYSLLVQIVSFLIWAPRDLGHVLEVKIATKSVSMRLCLHHCQRLLVLYALAVDWASPDHHLLLVVLLAVVHVLLVLFVIVRLRVALTLVIGLFRSVWHF